MVIEMYQTAFRTFDDGSSIGFGRGKIDNFCVYVKEQNRGYAPLDSEYFQFVHELASKFGTIKVYTSFKRLYEIAELEIVSNAIEVIDKQSERYAEFELRCQKYFSILYLAMVAEQNYPNTMLGKRLKRLGIYQLLFEEMTVEEAANWSRGKPWKEISEECESRGF